jgi:peptide chain release factor 1
MSLARLEGRLSQALERFEFVESRMAAATSGDEITRLAKEHSDLKPLADAVTAWREARKQEAELKALLSDPEMAELAQAELKEIEGRIPALERQTQILLLPKDKDESASAVLEIRAGTGGEEAALFAGDLFRMYQRYASIKGWKLEIESMTESDLGGYREIVASVVGKGVYGRMKYESGVHRVQRVPETEAGGRVHTSAATVAVLPEPEDVDVQLNMEDVRVDTMRSSGAGGQHVNKTDSAVRMTHIPSGIVVVCQEKSQHQNRANAIKLLKVKLYERERDKLATARAAERKDQVGSGDRSERIRTYNFPQGRVTDHRINLTLYNLPEVLNGGALDEVLDALAADEEAGRLAALEEG